VALLQAGLAPSNGLIDNAQRNLAVIVAQRGRVVEGLALLDSSIVRSRARSVPGAAYQTGQRVPMLLQLDRVGEAWRDAVYADSVLRTRYPEDDWHLGEADRWVGLAAFARGDYRIAAARFGAALEIRRQDRADTTFGPAQMACALGSALEALGRREEALRLLRQACPIHDAGAVPDPLIAKWGRAAVRRAQRGGG